MMDRMAESFASLLSEQGIQLTETQLQQFEIYYRELIEWNNRMNLTAITDRDQVYLKHFYDSMTLAFHFDMQTANRLADIGSGAGFPGVPLKIAFPHLEVTIIDSLNKRISFLNHLRTALGLDGFQAIHGRAEELGRQSSLRDSFDLVTARAVARMNVLAEYCMPFVRPGGWFAAMKGPGAAEELAEAGKAISVLGGGEPRIHTLTLPVEEAERTIILVEKLRPTPGKYPRKPGLPQKEPIR